MAEPAGFAIPPEFQQALDEAMKRQQIAQMLTQRSLNFQGPQQVGPVASKTSPLNFLANLAGGAVGGYLGNSASQDLSKIRQDYSNAEAADLARVQGLPEAEGIQQGTLSQFARSRELAKTMRDQMEKRREKGAEFISSGGDVPGALKALSSPTGAAGYTPAPYKDPSVSVVPDPSDPTGQARLPMLTNYDKYGRPTAQLGAQGSKTNIKIDLPGKEGEYALKRESDDLEAMQGKARAAQQVLATTEQLTRALEEGAKTGGLADPAQTARKFFSAFGATFPETGPTDTAKQLFGKALLDNAKKLGINPTDADAKRIENIMGTIDTDPNAIPQLLAFMNGGAFKTLQDFSTFVATKRQGEGAKRYPGLYDTADVGIKMPDQLYGPPDVQLKTVEALRQFGGDPTQFRQPQVAGETAAQQQPFPAGFNAPGIKGIPITPPVVGREPPAAPAKAPIPVGKLDLSTLSPADRAALMQVLQQLQQGK